MTAPNSLAHPLEAVVFHEGRPLARCVLRRGRYVIGQERRSEIVVDAPSVSARHAQLTVEGDSEFSIEDLGSANGTRVNGHPTHGPTAFTLECHVEIGSTSLEFQRGGLPASVFQYLPAGFLGAQRYVAGEIVVQGSTSTIYEAHDLALHRAVAMKTMLPASQLKPGYVLRFIREAQIAAQLQHPGILPIHDLGLDEKRQLFSVTRFVEGDSLAGILDALAPGADSESPRLSLAALIAVFQKICDAVAYAHSRGVVHCTLRPENITVGRYGEVFVNNWGLAKLLVFDGESVSRVQAPEASAEPVLSRYSAPEQAEAALDLDTRADIHALGGLLFRILTLRDPISAETESELLEQALSPRDPPSIALANQPPCPHWPGDKLPDILATAAMKALSLARDDRHTTVRALQQEVATWQEGVAGSGTDAGKLWKGFTGLLRKG